MYLESGKRGILALISAVNDQNEARRIFITDRKTKISFLIDTGADVCVFPRTRQKAIQRMEDSNFLLQMDPPYIHTGQQLGIEPRVKT